MPPELLTDCSCRLPQPKQQCVTININIIRRHVVRQDLKIIIKPFVYLVKKRRDLITTPKNMEIYLTLIQRNWAIVPLNVVPLDHKSPQQEVASFQLAFDLRQWSSVFSVEYVEGPMDVEFFHVRLTFFLSSFCFCFHVVPSHTDVVGNEMQRFVVARLYVFTAVRSGRENCYPR